MKLLKYNELNASTYLSANSKAREYNQLYRAKNFSDFVFDEFIGSYIDNKRISKIEYGGSKSNVLLIMLTGRYDIDFGSNHGYISYIIDKDKLSFDEDVDKIDRKSANLLSKIILKANPNSKYKNVNNIPINGY